MKWPSSSAPHSRKMSRTSSVVTRAPSRPRPSIPASRARAPRRSPARLHVGNAGRELQRCQHIGELREVAHLDLEDELVEVGRAHPHHEIMDVGLAARNGRGDLRQRAGLVHAPSARSRPCGCARSRPFDVPAHVDPGDIGVVELDQRVGVDAGRCGSGSPGSRMPTSRSPGTTPSGETSTSVLKSSSSSAIAARGPLLLLLVELEAEEVGGAQREPALGLVGHRQLSSSRFLRRLMPLSSISASAKLVGRDLALAHRDQQLALAGVAEPLGQRLALGLVERRPLALEQERQDVLAQGEGALLLAPGARRGGWRRGPCRSRRW